MVQLNLGVQVDLSLLLGLQDQVVPMVLENQLGQVVLLVLCHQRDQAVLENQLDQAVQHFQPGQSDPDHLSSPERQLSQMLQLFLCYLEVLWVLVVLGLLSHLEHQCHQGSLLDQLGRKDQ